jgi:nicotinate phosphoribosyltransferase
MDFLKGYRFDSSEVSITQYGDQLQIVIEGYWYRTILWEVYLLSEISELYYLMTNQISEMSDDQLKQRNGEKGTFFRMNDIQFADFGTRRRYSYENQDKVINQLKSYGGNKFVGTSNLAFAIDYGIKAIGTYSHELISGIASIMGYKHANRYTMDIWSHTYQGNLGIALTDCFGIDSFLQDFDLKYAKLFDGVRHDSGDPILFADKIIEHYNKLNIDPIKFNKTIVFSDALYNTFGFPP